MNEWTEFDEEIEDCDECGTLSHPKLCPKHEVMFENWHALHFRNKQGE